MGETGCRGNEFRTFGSLELSLDQPLTIKSCACRNEVYYVSCYMCLCKVLENPDGIGYLCKTHKWQRIPTFRFATRLLLVDWDGWMDGAAKRIRGISFRGVTTTAILAPNKKLTSSTGNPSIQILAESHVATTYLRYFVTVVEMWKAVERHQKRCGRENMSGVHLSSSTRRAIEDDATSELGRIASRYSLRHDRV